MRILSAVEFMKEPYGTVYITYTPQMFVGNPCVKDEERGENSWWAKDVAPWVKSTNSLECCMILAEHEKDSTHEYETEPFIIDDATYNYDKTISYAVFSKSEVELMIKTLTEANERRGEL